MVPHIARAHAGYLLLTGRAGARRKPDLLKRFNLICAVQARFQKHFSFLSTQITGLSRAIPCPLRGAFRDRHGRWVRDAVDAAASSRVIDARTNGEAADGEVVWS